MKYKKSLVFICLLFCLFSIASVVASDVNETAVVSEDQSDEIISIENDERASIEDNVEEIGASEENELSSSVGTFTDLANEINNAGDQLNLTKDYIYSNNTDSSYKNGIKITKKITINGNGFSIKGDNKAKALYLYYAHYVVINNISFVNCFQEAVCWVGDYGILSNCSFINCSGSSSSNDACSAVYWYGSNGCLTNCSFVNCSSSGSGYNYYSCAVYWKGNQGILSNCSFMNCSSFNSDSCYGAIVYWKSIQGILSNCSFMNCSIFDSSNRDGNIIFLSASQALLSNCSLINCYSNRGNAIQFWGSKNILSNCNFVNCSGSSDGATVYESGSNCKLTNCNFVNCSNFKRMVYWSGDSGRLSNCNFVNCSVVKYGSTVSWYGSSGSLTNCSFVNCSENIGQTVSWFGSYGHLTNCSFVSYLPRDYGYYVMWEGTSGSLTNCSFINCSSFSSIYSSCGTVSWSGSSGSLINCSFMNCSHKTGRTVSWSGSSGSLTNCSFVNCSANKGGAIEYIGEHGSLVGCSFVCCSSRDSGGAVYWNGTDGVLSESIFVRCSSDKSGGAVYWYGENGSIVSCGFINCSYSSVNSIIRGGAVYWCGENGSLDGCGFINCSSYSLKNVEGAVFWNGAKGLLYSCAFVNCSSYKGCVFINGSNYIMDSCGFVNSTSYNKYTILARPNNGGHIYDCGDVQIFLINSESRGYKFSEKELPLGENYRVLKKFIMCLSAFNWDDNTIFLTPEFSENKNVKLYINDVYKDTLLNGNKYSFSDLNSGNYSIKMIYEGDRNYLYSESIYGIEIYRITIITPSIKNINYGENTVVNVKLSEGPITKISIPVYTVDYFPFNVVNNITGILRVTVDDKLYECDVNNSNVSLIIPALSSGSKIANIEFYGKNNYMDNKVSKKFNINKINANISVNGSSIYNDTNVTILVRGPNDATGNVKLTIYNTDYIFDVVNGVANVKLYDLNAGNYSYTITYSGDNNYNSFSCVGSFKVNITTTSNNANPSEGNASENKTLPEIAVPSLDKPSANGFVTVKLPSDATGTVTLNIGGKNYNFNVVNGVANVKMPDLTNGAYSYSIIYSGDGKYSSFTKTGKVTVNKPASKPTVTTLTLKKVKVKRSAKKLVISATLKVNGKAVKGKTIKFKFNKKTYKARTNAKGVAKITVKKSVLKKLKAGKKVKYQATYGKITKKVTVKVKK